MMGLFDDRDYRDRDYAAAADWVAELTHGVVTELPAGLPSSCFCPIACALNDALGAPDWDPERFYEDRDEREEYVQAIGGSSYLFSVDGSRICWPFDHARPTESFRKADDETSTNLLDTAIGEGYDLRDDGGDSDDFVVPVADVPDDCFAAGGLVDEFIRRFDAGEFPSLLLDCQED